MKDEGLRRIGEAIALEAEFQAETTPKHLSGYRAGQNEREAWLMPRLIKRVAELERAPRVCPACRGKGWVYEASAGTIYWGGCISCPDCDGKGVIRG